MRYLFIITIALCSIMTSCFAGNPAVVHETTNTVEINNNDGGICEAVAALRDAKTIDEVKAAAVALEAVAEQEPENWLAHYHLAYAYGRIAHNSSTSKDIDAWADKADATIQKAAQCDNADASEVYVIEAFINYARIQVNPMMRGYKLSKKAMSQLGNAVKANENNPRAYLLISQHLLNVPAMLGGDPEKACEYNKTTQKAFDMEAADKERDPLNPSWGRSDSDAIAVENCGDETTSRRD